jgi:hypothetical protein
MATRKQLKERAEWLRVVKEDFGGGVYLSDETKKSIVIELTRYGCTRRQIHEALGFSQAFVNDVVREFAHQCLADEVRAHGQIESR